MPPKRRGSSASTPVKKQKAGPPSPEEFRQFYLSTVSLVLNIRDESSDDQLAFPFIKLPSRKLYPDYYELIEQPLCITDIQKKASKGKYSDTSADEFLADFQLLLDNATKYNDPESWIVTSAEKIFEFVSDQVKEFDVARPIASSSSGKSLKLKLKEPEAPKPSGVSFSSLPELCLEVLNSVINHEFPDEGILSTPFMDDVDVDEYPDYLNYVTTPTSFNSVIEQINGKKLFSSKLSILENLEKFYEATDLIFSNADAYNDPSSEIYQDAQKLKENFIEKYEILKSYVSEPESKGATKLKLKLNAKPKLKIKLPQAAVEEEEPKKKGRKKKVVKPAVKQEEEEDAEEEEEQEEEPEAEKDVKEEAEPADKKDVKSKSAVTEKTVANTLGKSLPTLSASECIIQESSILSSPSVAGNLPQHVQQKYNQLNIPLSRQQDLKKALFPTHPVFNTASVIEYKVPSNGYSSQSYSFALAPEISPYISFKVALHKILYDIKSDDLVNGHGYLNSTSDEDFQCKLYVNDEEVSNGGDCFEEKRDKQELLGLKYDLKLNYGLNVINFECKVSPSLSKKIKKATVLDVAEEASGRHTRHQLQQLKMTWDVETISFFVICNAV
ncbi:Bromodomain-containing protein [Scheffersomyces coipomensis]|uniref:Bromodomain-containing protein n=1 Tax=Scheffersomyces coipomensis TaxID=1788519 RepID=UPI00315D15F2